MKLMGSISNIMVSRYLAENEPSYHSQLKGDTEPSVAVHFRCSDNFDHSAYGIIPFRNYTNILKSIYADARKHIKSVTIFTDASAVKKKWDLCSRLIDALRRLIPSLPGYEETDVYIEYSTVTRSIAHMHSTKYIIAGASTFSFFASLGSYRVYIPASPVIRFPPDMFASVKNFVMFNTLVLRPSHHCKNCTDDEFVRMVHDV
jgi:hypothetical protein